jgi:hypothetical protein
MRSGCDVVAAVLLPSGPDKRRMRPGTGAAYCSEGLIVAIP